MIDSLRTCSQTRYEDVKTAGTAARSLVASTSILLGALCLLVVLVDPALAEGISSMNPALLDTDGTPGPSVGDEEVYMVWDDQGAGKAKIVSCHSACSTHSGDVIQLTSSGAIAGEWDGFSPVGTPEVTIGLTEDSREGVSPTFSGFQWENTRAGHESTVGGVSCGAKDCPATADGINGANRVKMATDGGPDMDVDIIGLDDDSDGTPEYIRLPYVGNNNTCGDCGGRASRGTHPDLWLPVDPTGQPGVVQLQLDLDADGSADAGFGSWAYFKPTTLVPVELQSFTISDATWLGPVPRQAVSLLSLLALPVAIAVVRRRPKD